MPVGTTPLVFFEGEDIAPLFRVIDPRVTTIAGWDIEFVIGDALDGPPIQSTTCLIVDPPPGGQGVTLEYYPSMKLDLELLPPNQVSGATYWYGARRVDPGFEWQLAQANVTIMDSVNVYLLPSMPELIHANQLEAPRRSVPLPHTMRTVRVSPGEVVEQKSGDTVLYELSRDAWNGGLTTTRVGQVAAKSVYVVNSSFTLQARVDHALPRSNAEVVRAGGGSPGDTYVVTRTIQDDARAMTKREQFRIKVV